MDITASLADFRAHLHGRHSAPSLGGSGVLKLPKDEVRLRMEVVQGADQLTTKYFETMQRPSILAAKVQVECAPMLVRLPRILPKDIEVRFPLGPVIFHAHRIGQRPVEGVALSNAEQGDGYVVDAIWQLVDLIIEQSMAKVHVELMLDVGNARQITKDSQTHTPLNQ